MRSSLVILSCCLLVASAMGATKKQKKVALPTPRVAVQAVASAPVQTAHRRSPYVGAISVDAATGRVLFEENADTEAYPASVTKLMTLLLVLEDVKAGRYGFDKQVTATADAYYSEPSWVGLKVGEQMSVRDLCTVLMVESANDAAIVLGVNSAGSYAAFVERMNARAKELGMAHTRYYNPNGLPPNPRKRYPWKTFNVSTARDQMKLACALVKMPEVLQLTSVKTCDLIKTSDGYRVSVTRRTNEPLQTSQLLDGEKTVKSMKNHNNVMRTDKLKIVNQDGSEAVDGLKTGYIDAGGSSISLTGTCKGKRAVVVVLGSTSSKERDANARQLLLDALSALTW